MPASTPQPRKMRRLSPLLACAVVLAGCQSETRDRLLKWSIPEPMSGCWLWFGTRDNCGYGSIGVGQGKRRAAHRVSYEAHVGPIPAGLLVCHKCDTPACINPDHLFLGTAKDNAADMWAKGRGRNFQPPAAPHCKRGHTFSEDNIRYRPNGTRRGCRLCDINRKRATRGLPLHEVPPATRRGQK